jgi:hypothetical protein
MSIIRSHMIGSSDEAAPLDSLGRLSEEGVLSLAEGCISLDGQGVGQGQPVWEGIAN